MSLVRTTRKTAPGGDGLVPFLRPLDAPPTKNESFEAFSQSLLPRGHLLSIDLMSVTTTSACTRTCGSHLWSPCSSRVELSATSSMPSCRLGGRAVVVSSGGWSPAFGPCSRLGTTIGSVLIPTILPSPLLLGGPRPPTIAGGCSPALTCSLCDTALCDIRAREPGTRTLRC